MRFLVYLRERFPPLQFVPLAALLAGAGGCCLQARLYGGLVFPAGIALSFAALLLFLLRLRLADELADEAHDRVHYPDLPLPRGLVSRGDLRAIGGACLAAETALALAAGGAAPYYFAAALVYSLLMRVDFFAGERLRRSFALYIFSHELLALPLFLYAAALQAPDFSVAGEPGAWAISFFLGLTLFVPEVARKMRPERPGQSPGDTYSSRLGPRGSALLLCAAAAAALASGWLACGSPLFAAALVPCLFLAAAARAFAVSPTPAASKRVFISSSLFLTLTCMLACAAALR